MKQYYNIARRSRSAPCVCVCVCVYVCLLYNIICISHVMRFFTIYRGNCYRIQKMRMHLSLSPVRAQVNQVTHTYCAEGYVSFQIRFWHSSPQVPTRISNNGIVPIVSGLFFRDYKLEFIS